MQPHRPRKRFGQHFLVDHQIIERLVRAIAPRPGERLLEIGPGEGVLTRPLLAAGAAVTAVELDRDLASSLADRLGQPPRLDIVQGDILATDVVALAGDQALRVVGNLPYNISTPILFHLFDHLAAIGDMHFMLQKEVIDRLVADPGGREYGRLSVMASFFCEMNWLFDVPPEAFRPPPKVVSAIVRLRPKSLSEAELQVLPALDAVVRQAFGQRRKTLRNSLRGLLDSPSIEAAGVDPGTRPERLSLQEFLQLALTTR
ncbi:16S rRNA (adenine(1518)-N(6)/adenine(1519)-N(6))-dimethyltransferase RsmA [Wenzhouxiangella limi]|uniref:16S rRNA (adenine(1518)-N(6)/adenine(1519)-N(6))- dimethyltransferase RsmA n=1 Tax=Wenzhouxiangella limi TaxID=2707351 RepID=UPI0030B8484C